MVANLIAKTSFQHMELDINKYVSINFSKMVKV